MKKRKVQKCPVDNSRKAIRKQKRKQKKIHRQEHYSKKQRFKEKPEFAPGKFVKRPTNSPDIDMKVKIKKQNHLTSQDMLKKDIQKEKKETEKLKTQMDEQRKKMLFQANEEEDKIIKKLEKRLGLNKSKNKNNYFAEDGLDYLLETCDRSTTEQIVAAEKHLANVEDDSDFEEDLATVTGKDKIKNKIENKHKENKTSGTESDESGLDDELSDENFGEELDEEMSDGIYDETVNSSNSDISEPEEIPSKKHKVDKPSSEHIKDEHKFNEPQDKKSVNKIKIISEKDINKVFSDDEISHLSGDDDVKGISDDENDTENRVENKKEKPDVWEDIYGRKRDKDGNIIKEEKGIYIPPHLRNKDSTSEKELIQLKRQIKSVLNKLSGSNLHWACNSIESLYSANSRNSVNQALTALWFEATIGLSATPDRLVAEHAALIAVLHANVATEIGAHFLQEICEKFDVMMKTSPPVEDKQLDNLVLCLAHLYNFKICQTSLIYDVMDRLVSALSEKSCECVVAVLRAAGAALRRDATALRGFLLRAQAAAARPAADAATGSRIKFLLEILLAVKNNNLNKIPNYDPSYSEQLQKQIRGVIRKGNYITPLNIGLEDLLKADERGKWWVVGSAWEGNNTKTPEKVKLPASADKKLLELARKQRMNTDVRRSIFCVIMSAEDFMDAFEKLQHLGLKGQQEREIVHVLLACCLQERTYNPYYALLGQKLCDFDRKYQLSIQFAVWDKIRDIQNLLKQNVSNLAQFLIHLIMEKGLALSVLKVIEFSDLNKSLVKFMRQILLAIIMNVDLPASLEVFHRISKSQKLHTFRESLRLFIQHFLIKNAGKRSEVISDDEMATLKERTLEVDKVLTMHDSKLRF